MVITCIEQLAHHPPIISCILCNQSREQHGFPHYRVLSFPSTQTRLPAICVRSEHLTDEKRAQDKGKGNAVLLGS